MLYNIAFWACILFLVGGMILGVAGVWMPKEFWERTGYKLVVTDIILFVTALAIALVTKWLSP